MCIRDSYKSDLFGGILKAATRAESKFIFRQNNNKLSVVVRNIKNISEATAALHELAEKAAQEPPVSLARQGRACAARTESLILQG